MDGIKEKRKYVYGINELETRGLEVRYNFKWKVRG